MKIARLHTCWVVAVLWALAVLTGPVAAGGELPAITILATGGTIAGSGESAVGSAYQSGAVTVDILLEAVPDVNKIARITGEQIAQIGSQEMNNAVWLKLSGRINALLASDACDGVVITHGTDTIEETAYFLNLTVHSEKPVVLVGAMRSATSMSADGPLNIYNAVAVAASSQAAGKGVLVVMNDIIHSARGITKTHTTNAATFGSPDFGPLGSVYYGRVSFYRASTRRHTHQSEFNVGRLRALPRVDIVYGYANNSRTAVDALVADGVQGIVHAGVGNGNPYPDTLEGLADARKQNIAVVRSSRCGGGPVTLEAEVDDEAYGFVVADSLNPQKSRVLLMLALTRTTDPEEIQRMFFEY